MTSLPAELGGAGIVAWRLDQAVHAATWDTGEGAFRVGGRWNSRGRRVVYCALDPATAIVEVAAHKGFNTLDIVPHVLTSIDILPAAYPLTHVVNKGDVPNSNWMRPGIPSAGQQQFGDQLLSTHPIIVIPSVVSSFSWNLIFDSDAAKGLFQLRTQEPFALDPRLSPP